MHFDVVTTLLLIECRDMRIKRERENMKEGIE